MHHSDTFAPSDAPVTWAFVGAGNRGQAYATWVREHPMHARIAAVADPVEHRRDRVAGGTDVRAFDDWRQLAAAGRIADAAVVTTQDREHVEPARELARLGYHVLLEKPIAPTEAECRDLVTAITGTAVLFGVCHVMRYTPYTDLVKSVVDSSVIGNVVDVQHLEPVGWWHAAHSYVRGPWAREATSTPMLLAKSSHDVDWIAYVTGLRIERVASFGSRRHFRADERPAGAANRCLDCSIEHACPYSAPRLYLTTLQESGPVWPVSTVTHRTDEAGVIAALRDGPFGRCVYAADNDVVDHQVVAMELTGGSSATLTMTAFSEQAHRQTRIFGTHGCLEGDGESVRVVDFRTGKAVTHTAESTGTFNAADGHGGGDAGVVAAFTRAVTTGDSGHIRSGPFESLDSHLAVFAAERARREGTVVTVPPLNFLSAH